MRHRSSILAALAVVTLGADAQVPVDPFDAFLQPLAEQGLFAGTVLIARGDRVLFERSYGNASAEFQVPNTNETRYRIHSVTKQFTAMGIAILVQRGVVDFQASVRTYLPELPEQWTGVTVAHLLTHTSGIPAQDGAWFRAAQRHSGTQLDHLAQVAPLLANETLLAAPGTSVAYSNFGYELLSCIIERASHMPFPAFMRDNIFIPAHMTRAGFDSRSEAGDGSYVSPAMVPGLAHGYNGSPDRLQGTIPMMFAALGAGGMYATARDLWNYDRALNDGRLLPATAQATMAESVVPIRAGRGLGYGWIVTIDSTGRRLHHSGGNNGYTAEYSRYPATRTSIIVLGNRGYVDPEAIRDALARILHEAPASHWDQ